jgi:hypothetical protein
VRIGETYPLSEELKKNQYSYTIDTELSVGNLNYLPEYLRRRYLLQKNKYRTFFDRHVRYKGGNQYLSYKVAVPKKNQYVEIEVEPGLPIDIKMRLSIAHVTEAFLKQLYDDLFLMVQLFEEEIR